MDYEMKEKTIERREAYIWGAAKYGEYAMKYCKERFKISGFIDRRAGMELKEFCSKPVISPAQFFGRENDNADIIVAVRYPSEVTEAVTCAAYGGNLYIFDGRNTDKALLYKVEKGEICVPEYMDKRFVEWDEYSEHYSRLNPFVLKMFRTAVGWIEKYEKNVEIYEIGCGSGQFANMLFDNGYTRYIGIDFSSQAIKLARKANPSYANRFVCADVFSKLGNVGDNTLFVAFEVLEHIKKDLELIDMLPCGSNVIFSVPNFKSFNHIRIFDNLAAIQNRYGMLDIVEYLSFPANENADKLYHLIAATKR